MSHKELSRPMLKWNMIAVRKYVTGMRKMRLFHHRKGLSFDI
jgi:hypothetical protein